MQSWARKSAQQGKKSTNLAKIDFRAGQEKVQSWARKSAELGKKKCTAGQEKVQR